MIKAENGYLCQSLGNESVDGWLSQSVENKTVRK